MSESVYMDLSCVKLNEPGSACTGASCYDYVVRLPALHLPHRKYQVIVTEWSTLMQELEGDDANGIVPYDLELDCVNHSDTALGKRALVARVYNRGGFAPTTRAIAITEPMFAPTVNKSEINAIQVTVRDGRNSSVIVNNLPGNIQFNSLLVEFRPILNRFHSNDYHVENPKSHYA